jgi:hypothetical protein
VRLIQNYREGNLHRDEVEETFRRLVQAEVAQHQGLAVFEVDLEIKTAQLGRESQPGHSKGLIAHP